MNFEVVAAPPEAAAQTRNGASKMSCRKLDFYYGKFQGLKNINLEVAERCVTAFIGPSG